MNIEQILESYRKNRLRRRIRNLKHFTTAYPEIQQISFTGNKPFRRKAAAVFKARKTGKETDIDLDLADRKIFVRNALRGQQMADMKPDTSKEGLRKGYSRFMERENAMHMVNNPLIDRKAVLAQLQSRLSKRG